MSYRSFHISFSMKVDEEGNVLSLIEDEHERDVEELIANSLHDIDDVRIEKIKVRGKDYGR